jgi:rubrerythrin
MGTNRIMPGLGLRRGLLRGVGIAILVLASLTAVGCSHDSVRASRSEKEGDIEVLNTALSQELTAVDAYAHGLPLLRGPAIAVGREFRTQAQEHVDGITRAIRGLGGVSEAEAGAKPLDYSGLKTQADFLTLAYEEESSLIRFYMNAIPKLSTDAPRTLFAAIAANEAGHLAILREMLGAAPAEAAPEAFETGKAAPPAGAQRQR